MLNEMKPNDEHSACANCKTKIGEIPICDDEHTTFWICGVCDSELDWVKSN